MDAHALYSATDEGKPGLAVMDLTTHQAAALRVVGNAVSWRMEKEAEERAKAAKRGS
jgi:hypothetical protein